MTSWLRKNESSTPFFLENYSRIIRGIPSYLLRQTPGIHWDLRWSIDSARGFGPTSFETSHWGQKLHPVGVLKSSVKCFTCGGMMWNVALKALLCSGTMVVGGAYVSETLWPNRFKLTYTCLWWCWLLPWGPHWHRTAKGSTSTYHSWCAVRDWVVQGEA